MHDRVIRFMFCCFELCAEKALSLEAPEVVDVDRTEVAEERDQDREPDRRLGRRHRQYEEHEHLAREVAELVREGDEVHVDGEQHQLDRHQQDDEVLAVEEYSDHADREEQRAEDEEVLERNHGAAPGVVELSIDTCFTIRRRSALFADNCTAGSWYLVCLLLRSVNAIAAVVTTSRITAEISKGKT